MSGNNISSIFDTDAGTTVTFTHISMVNGNTPGYGAAINAQGNLVLISTTMSNNTASLNGGAVAVNGSLVISGATFADNVSGGGNAASDLGLSGNVPADKKKSSLHVVLSENLKKIESVRIVGAIVVGERELLAIG